MENRGEILLESLLSIAVISITLVLLTKSINTSFLSLRKINKKTNNILNEINVLELMKSLEYSKIRNFKSGYYTKKALARKLKIDEKYIYDGLGKIKINVNKTNMYVAYDDDKIYIYEIKVGKYESLWIPE